METAKSVLIKSHARARRTRGGVKRARWKITFSRAARINVCCAHVLFDLIVIHQARPSVISISPTKMKAGRSAGALFALSRRRTRDSPFVLSAGVFFPITALTFAAFTFAGAASRSSERSLTRAPLDNFQRRPENLNGRVKRTVRVYRARARPTVLSLARVWCEL